MYRLRKARKERMKKVWKVHNKAQKIRTAIHRKCVTFIERCFIGQKSRARFAKELPFIYEKMLHNETKGIFWFNHFTKTAAWEKVVFLLSLSLPTLS